MSTKKVTSTKTVTTKSAVVKTPAKTVVVKTPAKTVVVKTPAKTVVVKTPAKTVVVKTPAKTVVAKITRRVSIPIWVPIVFGALAIIFVAMAVVGLFNGVKAQGDASANSAELTAANTRATNAETQLAAANTRATNAETQLAAANTRATNAETQLAATVVTKFALGLPNLIDFREAVVQNGDENSANIIFGRDYPSMVLLRAVADDQFLEFTFHRNDGTSIDLLPILKMQVMDKTFLASLSSQEAKVLGDRGINLQLGEILGQNLNSIDLGGIQKGEYISVLLKDDVLLGANNGTIITFGDAPEEMFTVPLNK